MGGSTVLPFSTDFPGESTANGNDIFFVAEASRPKDDSTDLRFESRFESGNLGKVVKITDTYYQLYLRRDLYTQRHTQWYYFRVSNTRSRITYRYNRRDGERDCIFQEIGKLKINFIQIKKNIVI